VPRAHAVTAQDCLAGQVQRESLAAACRCSRAPGERRIAILRSLPTRKSRSFAPALGFGGGGPLNTSRVEAWKERGPRCQGTCLRSGDDKPRGTVLLFVRAADRLPVSKVKAMDDLCSVWD
jgi:hypothetical protein